MIIRKLFEVESAHIVRNCSSERCSHSIHGHSAKIEVFFESDALDNSQMVLDFGLMKGSIGQFIDSMDHSYLLCMREDRDFKEFIKSNCARYIEMPFNPSAEMLATFILFGVNYILDHTKLNNGEGDVRCMAVRYHETRTGYAEAHLEDVERFMKGFTWNDVEFSEGIRKDWSQELTDCIDSGKNIINPIIEQQIIL